ncbi:MAG: hypothetical protein L0332_19890 [Chloroflexi bacterium]|nr:hypothetical protein [Chloroflexota bacterium]MCI0578661.1 hypothetical protein [Chloroflexota bacterium]MCI0647234.1 hypothetical protein [Chloroflexota bacterium]MCI0728960.1 hypothetical protein [Chloroflexota bacterium]
MDNKRVFSLFLVVAALLLAGCGGGPSPSKPDVKPPQGGGPQGGGPPAGGPSAGGPQVGGPQAGGPQGNAVVPAGVSGPGSLGGVSLGGPGGGGGAGPAAIGGAGGMAQAGFGGRGGPGGSATLNVSPAIGVSGGGPVVGGGPGGAGLPGGVGAALPGGGAGLPGGPAGVNTLFGGGAGARFTTRPDGQTGLGNLAGRLPAGLTFGEGQFQLPPATTLLEDLDQAAAAQETAQQAFEQAQETGQDAATQAQAAAQDAYEQLWHDYYAAVDYAAQAYYDTVTAAIDYGAETFEAYYDEAVQSAYEVVDYYYNTYYDWTAYCALYPWDCYQYTYDEATGTYMTNETVNNYYYTYTTGQAAPATTEAMPTTQAPAPAPAQAPAISPPAPSEAAYEAIVVFANDQLGATVEPMYAGEVTEEVLALLQMLPVYAQNAAYTAVNVSTASYYALLQGGVAAVSVGECAEGSTCQLSSDIPAELSNASLGVYALQTAEALPATAAEALELLTLVYPRLTGLDFTQVTSTDVTIPGYAFTATTTSAALINGQPGFVTKVVFAGVASVDGRTVVYATVGLGETYASLTNPLTP